MHSRFLVRAGTLRWSTLGMALALAVLAPGLAAQQGTITGTIRDAGSQRPLDGVQVYVPGTSLGALSNASGRFLLTGVPVGQTEVRAEMVGYTAGTMTVTVSADQAVVADFSLRQTAITLDEIVVSGAGQATEKKKLGNVVASVNVDELRDAPISNFSEMIQGREAGVNLSSTGGMAGEASQIRIRGTSSLTQNNNPIVYVDGIRVDASVNDGAAGAASRLDDINPDAIERIEILKGAAAATLYGTEASNGVIQIFTKQGVAGQAQWEGSIEGGFSQQNMDRYPMHAGFACSRAGKSYIQDGCTQAHADRIASYWGLGSLGPYDVFEVPLLDPLFETGNHQAYSLSVRGGTDRIQYFLSGRYADEDGSFGGNQWGPASDVDQQKQAVGNVTFFPGEDVRLRFNAMYTERYHEVPTNGNNTTGTFSMAIMSKPELASDANVTGTCCFATMREMYNIEQNEETQRFAGSFNAQYNPLQDLTIDATFGVDFSSSQEIDFRRFGWDVDKVSQYAPQGDRGLRDHNRREVTLDLKTAWDHQVSSNFSSSFIGGAQLLQSNYHQNYSYGFSFPAPGLEVTGAAAEPTAGEQIVEAVNAGVYVQEQIGYQNFLFATVGARYDKHSAFGQSAGGAVYPKASISFVPSDLDSWSGMGPISSARLRAAIGQSGLQPGAFDKFTTFSPLPATTGAGVRPSNLGNPDLEPEVSTEWEVGADLGLLEDRLSLDLTYWNRTVTDVLVPRLFAPSGGFTTAQLINLGEMTANGLEVGLRGSVFNTPSASFDAFLTAAYLKEEVTDMGDAPPIKVGYYRYRTWIAEGYAPGSFFTRMLADTPYPFDQNRDGQADSQAEMLAFLSNPTTPDALNLFAAPATENGPDGEYYRGKPAPDWSGSFGGTLSFLGNFRLATQFDYAFGNFYRQNISSSFRNSHSTLGRNTVETARIESILANPASTPEQRLEAAQEWTKFVSLSPWSGLNAIEEADYIRWRELSLSYTVPGGVVERMGLDRLTLSAAARNLNLWTKYSGIDPDNNVTTGRSNDPTQNFVYGIDGWRPGTPRRFTFSARFGF